jgi:hypothetical protein
VKGALALLDYRGQEQLGNPIGLRLIRSLRTQVVSFPARSTYFIQADKLQVVNCLVRRVDVPETILKWSRLAREHETNHEVSESELADLMAKFCNLQVAIECQNLESDPSIFVSSALSIDTELAEWAVRWQTPDLYATIVVQEANPAIFEDYWHLYPNIMIALIWNHYRCIRVLINQIIITQLGYMTTNLDPDLVFKYSPVYNDQMDSSRRTTIELSHKICASVPYYLDQYPGDSANSWNTFKNAASKNARAKLILWPLYVAGQTEFVSDIMRTWVVDQLEGLAEDIGTHKLKAKGLAELLRKRQRAVGQAWRQLGMHDE